MSEGFHEWPVDAGQPRWPQPQAPDLVQLRGEEAMRQRIVAHQLDQASWQPDDDPRTALHFSDVELEARRYAAGDAGFAMLRAIQCSDLTPVVLTRQGTTAWPPTKDLRLLLDQWRRTEDAQPGFACGAAHNLLGVSFTDEGLEWLYRARLQPIDRSEVEDPRHPPQAYARDHLGSVVALGTVPDPGPNFTSIAFMGQRGAEAASRRVAERRGSPRVVRRILFWTWPQGQNIPYGEVAPGVVVIDSCPAEGALVLLDGELVAGGVPPQPWLPCPAWLVDAFGGKPIAPPSLVPRRAPRLRADNLGVV